MCIHQFVILPERELLLMVEAFRFVEGRGDKPLRPVEYPLLLEMVSFDISLFSPAGGTLRSGLFG